MKAEIFRAITQPIRLTIAEILHAKEIQGELFTINVTLDRTK